MMGICRWWAEVQEERRKAEECKRKRWQPEDLDPCRQTVLFAGTDCLPGQLDLFETDGENANHSDRAWPGL